MPLVSLATLDTAGGGLIAPTLQTFARTGGKPWAVVGDAVADHGTGPHNNATLAAGSAFVRVAGLPVVRAGDAASCGHLATGASHVTVSA